MHAKNGGDRGNFVLVERNPFCLVACHGTPRRGQASPGRPVTILLNGGMTKLRFGVRRKPHGLVGLCCRSDAGT